MVTTKFVYEGKNVLVFDFDEDQAKDKLVPAIYTVRLSPLLDIISNKIRRGLQLQTELTDHFPGVRTGS